MRQLLYYQYLVVVSVDTTYIPSVTIVIECCYEIGIQSVCYDTPNGILISRFTVLLGDTFLNEDNSKVVSICSFWLISDTH